MAKQQPNKRSVWSQRTDDIGSTGDKETMKIYNQMTGTGLVSTRDVKKGNNRRV